MATIFQNTPDTSKSTLYRADRSLYSTYLSPSESLEMTFPSTSKLLLIKVPSLKRMPSAPVALTRSEPAKSTMFCNKVKVKLNLTKASLLCVGEAHPLLHPPPRPGVVYTKTHALFVHVHVEYIVLHHHVTSTWKEFEITNANT